MKLYTNPRGSNPKRVHMYLAEKGIEVDRQIIDFASTELQIRRVRLLDANVNGLRTERT